MSSRIHLRVIEEGGSPATDREVLDLETADPVLIRAFAEALRKRMREGAAGAQARWVMEALERIEEGEDD